MKLSGTPGHGLKHVAALTQRHGLNARGDSRKWVAHPNMNGGGKWEMLWPIEGEQLTTAEIHARVPHLTPSALYGRLNAGDRTWKRLGRPSGERTEKQKEAYNKRLRKAELWRKAEMERIAYLKRLKEGHAKL